MNLNKVRKSYFDLDLLLIIFVFMGISCFYIYSAQKYLPYGNPFAIKQAIYFCIGLILTSVVYYFDLSQIKRMSIYLYLFGIGVLAFLLVAPESIAEETKGAKSWFQLPGFSVQPSEFMKVFLILFLAKIIVSHNDKFMRNKSLKYDFILLLKLGLAAIPPLGLILLQPDAGTAMVIAAILIGMIFVSGVNWRIIFTLILTGISAVGTLAYIYLYHTKLLLSFLGEYQINRIHAWVDPFNFSEGYQLKNSILAIGSGMDSGRGFNNGVMYVPEAHSDFIFTVIGEEGGFIVSSMVIALYFIMIYKIIAIATLNKGQYERYICIGIVSMLTFHIFENIGMVMGLVPITGIPLPLLSYGGSSVLGTLLALSIVLNISAKTKTYMFSK